KITGTFQGLAQGNFVPGSLGLLKVFYNATANVSDGNNNDLAVITNTPPTITSPSLGTVIPVFENNTKGQNPQNVNFNVTAIDLDNTGPLSYSASYNGIDLSLNPLPGATFNTSSQVFNWSPSEVQGQQSYNITFAVNDTGATSLRVVKIDVAEVNESPNINIPFPSYQGNETENINFNVSATDPDRDANGNPLNNLTFSLVNGLAGMTIDPVTGQFNWTPTEAQVNVTPQTTIVVGFAVQDGVGGSNAKNIVFTLNELNSRPYFVPGSF